VEKFLEKEGLKKKELGREKFLKKVNDFARESHDTIVQQIRKMGASVDWSREAFTLDEERSLAVRTAFKKMYVDGLIYRGHRIVNWDPKGQTVVSDDEVVYKEQKTKFYTFQYGPFRIGTARPETKFGDKYVVMHPNDERYKKYKHGEKIKLEWINGPVEATIIKDPSIDMEFGTGAMTITPWHSHEDFQLAEKYRLDKEQIIDQFGRLLPVAGEFADMKIAEAREKIAGKLKNKGLLVSLDENYINRVATAERSGGIIEPQVMEQWFVDVNKKISARGNKSLKELMLEPVQNRQIKIIPERFEKIYYHWVENLRDWCISRQLWYGHQIPVWYPRIKAELGSGQALNKEIYCDIEPPKDIENWEQDPDTLDTWFSSGLWTFSTLGWPAFAKATAGQPCDNDLANFHPTSIVMPGYEILFFWVARMILMSQYLLGEIPFKTVYLHGMVRNIEGKKFSKSAGNNIDPLDIAAEYGTDALRMALVVGVGPGNDTKFDLNKVKAYKHFANKIWNITRFILSNTENIKWDKNFSDYLGPEVALNMERDDLIKELTREMEDYKFYLVADKLYQYIWTRLADKIIEESKIVLSDKDQKAKISRAQFLLNTLVKMVVVLHPFMPFLTEEIWQILMSSGKNLKGPGNGLLMVESWPIFTEESRG
jgi:valyl-tRNA synthetase